MEAEVRADPNNIAAHSSLAVLLTQASDGRVPDYNAALEQYTLCIDQLFGQGTPESNFAAIYRSPAIVRALNSAGGLTVDIQGIVPPLFIQRGYVSSLIGRQSESVQDYRVASELLPPEDKNTAELTSRYRQLGDSLMQSRSFARAAENYRFGLALDGNDVGLRASLAKAYRLAGAGDRSRRVEVGEDKVTGVVP